MGLRHRMVDAIRDQATTAAQMFGVTPNPSLQLVQPSTPVGKCEGVVAQCQPQNETTWIFSHTIVFISYSRGPGVDIMPQPMTSTISPIFSSSISTPIRLSAVAVALAMISQLRQPESISALKA